MASKYIDENISTNIESEWTDNTYGRFPSSHTKTWWRELVNLPKSDRKPKQMCRLIKGYQTQAMRAESQEDTDSPIRAVRPRLAKLIGAKSCKQVIKWHHALKLEKQKWPHGYKGHKSHHTNYILDKNDHIYEYDNLSDEYDNLSDEEQPPETIEDSKNNSNILDQFPLLIPSNFTNQYEIRKTVWLTARAKALDPLRIAIRKAHDANLVANDAKMAFFKAAEDARTADKKYMSCFWSKPIHKSNSLQAAQTEAIIARNKADQLALIMIQAQKIADSLQITQ